MQYRRIAALETDITTVGFGTWPLAGECDLAGRPVGRGKVDVAEARRALAKALDAGVNCFDTAPTYGDAERLLGEALANRSEDIVVCTKFGIRVTPDGRAIKDFSSQSLQTSFENSLRNLKRDRIEVLLLHSPHDEFDWLDYNIGPLEQLQQQGKLGCYGVSCHSVAGAERALLYGFGGVIEVIYNAMDRRAEEGVLENAADKGVAVIARVPLAQGFLAGRYCDTPPTFCANDHRSTFTAEEIAWLSEAARRLSFLDELPGGMPVSALRFCLTHPAVTTTIPGMRSQKQVAANILAGELGPLERATLEQIARAVPEVYPGWQRKVSA